MSRFEKLRWKLFGETKIIFWLIGVGYTLFFAFWGFVIYIIWHFLSKYW